MSDWDHDYRSESSADLLDSLIAHVDQLFDKAGESPYLYSPEISAEHLRPMRARLVELARRAGPPQS